MLVKMETGGSGEGKNSIKFENNVAIPSQANMWRFHTKNMLLTNTAGAYFLVYIVDGVYTVDHNTVSGSCIFNYDPTTNIFTAYNTSAVKNATYMYEDLDS